MEKPNLSSRILHIVAIAVIIICLFVAVFWKPFGTTSGVDKIPGPNAITTSRGANAVDASSAATSVQPGSAEATAEPPTATLIAANANGTAKNQWVALKRDDVSIPVPADFLKQIMSADEKTVTVSLPEGGTVVGKVTMVQQDGDGLLLVQGDVTAPEAGKFMFQRQTEPGVAGPLVGHIHYDKSDVAYQIRPLGKDGGPELVKVPVDEVICRALPAFADDADAPEDLPQNHPTDYPIPPGENGIIQLQSLPGASAVVYLDFDGEEDTFLSWGYINALPSGRTASQIFDVWRGIAEDYQPFNINITTVRSVYDSAPQGRRMHVIFTPTTDAAPGSGGVAYVGSFNQTGHRVCWVFYSSGKNAVEAGSHEIGHTLGLSHDGRISPVEDYYRGHNGWAPIMGVGYYQPLSQWSKGEYPSANQTQDDLKIITTNNNAVAYRTDDSGATYATSAWLDIDATGTVLNEGIIETTGDQDGFRFTTQGGMASLAIKNVSFNANLDIVAEILTPAGVVVSSSDPDDSTTASFSAVNLVAGNYFLRISGAGKGEQDLSTGYTNYGSLGAYVITGTIAGADPADHFNIAENAASGSPVGTSVPRADHGAGVPAFAISSGNATGAFTINPSTGSISVASSSKLDFETLSTRWDDPATFELFISITDSLGIATESIRTVVTVGDINEAPLLTALASQTVPENLSPATVIATASATDVDRSDRVSYSISSGNTGNAFAIDAVTGAITVAGVLDFETTAGYTLMVRATDHGIPVMQVEKPLIINVLNTMEGLVPGSIVRAFYKGISGALVTDLTGNPKFPGSPDSFETLTSFDGTPNVDDNFGSTICGYVVVPVTGNYNFWISSNEASELRLSPGTNPADAVVRASLSTTTTRYNWTAKTSQKSATIALIAGQAYYVEVRHKEGAGDDHVEVAWQVPGMSAKEVIPGRWLAPFPTNYSPVIESASFQVRENAVPGTVIGSVTGHDLNPMDSLGAFAITGGNVGGAFAIDPASGQLSVALPGILNAASTPVQTLTIRANDNGMPPLTASSTVTVNVIPEDAITITGIVQEIWTGLSSGTAVSDLTGSAHFPDMPDQRRSRKEFDSGADFGDNYGSRIRVRFVPPTTGVYQFHISSDEDSRLRFSPDPIGAGAVEIASVTGACDPGEWDRFPSQKSSEINLVAGQAVYLESLQKEASGSDHVSVGYTGPGVESVTVIPGSLLQPFDINAAPVFSPASYEYAIPLSTATAGMVLGSVSATDPNGESIIYSIVSGNANHAFAIDTATGSIRVTDPALLDVGNMTLQVAAQDRGLGGVYPLAGATATVEIGVEGISIWSNPAGGSWQVSGNWQGGVVCGGAGSTADFSRLDLSQDAVITLDGPRTVGNLIFGDIAASNNWTLASGMSGPLELNRTDGVPAITVNNGSATIDLVLTGSKGLYKNGGGTLVFSGSNTYAGETFVTDGGLCVTGSIASPLVNVGVNAVISGSGSIPGAVFVKGQLAPGNGVGMIATGPVALGVGATISWQASDWAGGPGVGYDKLVSTSLDLTGSGQIHLILHAKDLVNFSDTPKSFVLVETTGGISGFLAGKINIDSSDLAIASGTWSVSLNGNDLLLDYTPLNSAPRFTVSPIDGGSAEAGDPFSLSIAGLATDADLGDSLSYTKLSGPDWLHVGSDGVLSGTPPVNNLGLNSFEVRVTDSESLGDMASLMVEVTGTPWQIWQLERFGDDAGSPTTAGELDDPDHDGISNLLEYVLALDPTLPDSTTSVLSHDVEVIEGKNYLRLTISRNPAASDVSLEVEVSEDMISWRTDQTLIECDTADILQVRDTKSLESGESRFIRAKAVRPSTVH